MTAKPNPNPTWDSPEAKTVAVVGAGSWGTTLAQLLAEKGLNVRLWVREPEVYADLQRDRINHTFLPGVRLSSRLTFTQEFPAALHGRRPGPHGGALPRLPGSLARPEASLPRRRRCS